VPCSWQALTHVCDAGLPTTDGLRQLAVWQTVSSPHLNAWTDVFSHSALLVEPAMVVLRSSRGHESLLSKLFMRWSVIASDVLVFFPAVLSFFLHGTHFAGRALFVKVAVSSTSFFRLKLSVLVQLAGCALVLLHPAFILIDHGHFQCALLCSCWPGVV
jgi:alpha-1,3-glucosyltransferase